MVGCNGTLLITALRLQLRTLIFVARSNICHSYKITTDVSLDLLDKDCVFTVWVFPNKVPCLITQDQLYFLISEPFPSKLKDMHKRKY